MKKAAVFVVFIIVAGAVFGQDIDRSQYEETTLFDVELWEKTGYETTTKKFKATVSVLHKGLL